MTFSNRTNNNILSKTVDDYSNQSILKPDLYILLFAAKHPENFFGKYGRIKIIKMLPAKSRLLCHLDTQHLIYPVMFDHSCFLIETQQVIIFIIPGQYPWTDTIKSPVPPQLHPLRHGPLIILKPNLYILRNGIMDFIYIIIDTFIHRLNPICHIDLALELTGFIVACQPFQFLNQLTGFLCRNKF